ncbi:MAG TPA: hypothetical protein VJ276_06080 [Thermoanaerobaculia bacterium]|nr:hypothetical protein [Thermoanaerobaculia bacterium]
MRKQSIPFLLCAVFMLLLTACPTSTPEKRTAEKGAQPAPAAAPTMNVEQTEAARQALVEWLECEECEEGQLEAVVKLGQPAVPSLRAALLEGASPASEELLRRELEKRYDELRRYAATHPNAKVASSKEEFVAMYVANLHAQYRTRAAQALSRIGGPAATSALREGLARADRPDVQATVKSALATAKQ